jgi:hypothetical protein
MVPTAKEERDDIVLRSGGGGRVDGTVPGHSDGVKAVGVAVACTQRHRRRRRKFWQSDSV